ncbi:unnamed protein product [Parnassius apollo]|uniref:(apollo) hypothetical protein n=1 Tax=Parnassius apollo TaxID=110799 RepID=A0A8S3XMR7_PARAO|nr:unnamed protein product [Parnassius apollo]
MRFHYALISSLTILSVVCAQNQIYRPISDRHRICLATFGKRLDNEVLEGYWYKIYHFPESPNPLPSNKTIEIEFKRPTEEELSVYKSYFNLTGMPYSFDEDIVMYRETWNKYYTGLLFGNREAKIFLQQPETFYTGPEEYDIKVFRYISDNYILFERCFTWGVNKWLMSKSRIPSEEEVQQFINNHSELKALK